MNVPTDDIHVAGVPARGSRPALVLLIVSGIAIVGAIDYVTGLEIRAFPLYFLPLSLAAWHFGRTGAVAGSLAAAATWDVSNWAAGLRYSLDHIWLINTVAQVVAFGTVALLLAWSRDLLRREQALARTDPLTGLANSRSFYESVELAAAVCRRHARPLTLAYIDLDNFKCVNDRHGHARGDAVLVDVANILRATLRITDLAARIGGDEFVVCLPETSADQGRRLLERLHAALREELSTDDGAVSASIGALSWTLPPSSIMAMVAATDDLMYQVKKSGKDRVEIMEAPDR